ncbi:hypothetical protein BDZ45DRAFT_219252 [Acephala macrosclerotiorum]|nr:hypothetical protein BDZ45DRAFT_219252 [Acephala macrosclerotiorum]
MNDMQCRTEMRTGTELALASLVATVILRALWYMIAARLRMRLGKNFLIEPVSQLDFPLPIEPHRDTAIAAGLAKQYVGNLPGNCSKRCTTPRATRWDSKFHPK